MGSRGCRGDGGGRHGWFTGGRGKGREGEGEGGVRGGRDLWGGTEGLVRTKGVGFTGCLMQEVG